MNKFLNKNFIYPLLLALLSITIAALNYTPGTFLSGWDTLHPEFNFPLAFERTINGVWRTDQGLGTIAIQSHMADLPRIFALWILSFIFPLSSLRYITILTPLIIGPLGIYFLSLFLLKDKKCSHLSSFLASLSYLCSLGTVQHFIVPLEMFAIHFAFLPWAVLFLLRYLEEKSRKNLLLLILINIFLIPQAHTATLLYVYILAIFITILSFVLINRSKNSVIKGIILAVIILIINSYVIFPNLFAINSQGEEVRNSRINRFFSQEAFVKNQEFGNIKDTVIVKSFLFDWQLYDYEKGRSVDVVYEWKENLKNPLILTFGYLIFIISTLGIITSFIFKKNKRIIPILPMMTICFIVLLNGTFPITFIFDNLSRISPTLQESLRFPFTKFSIFYMLGISVFFGVGVQRIFEKLKKDKIIAILSIVLITGFISYFAPAFKGYLVNPAMRINIPQEYFNMFDFFNKQDGNERVAILPIHSFWGWVYNIWGYQGAGFLQFGIKQPLLDRDHDRWSNVNEQYQREMQYAIYNQNTDLIRDVLYKYDVKWILFDTSIINLSGYQNETLAWQIPEMMSRIEGVKLKKKFGKDLYVYEVINHKNKKITLFKNMPDAGPASIGTYKDRIYSKLEDYKTEHIFSEDAESENYIFDEHFVGNLTAPIIAEINSKSELSDIRSCSDNAQISREVIGNTIRYKSTDGSLCDYFPFPQLSHEKSYIVTIESKNIEGFPLQAYICNDLSFHCNQTIYLKDHKNNVAEAFFIPSYDDFGNGHTININNYSIKGTSSINELVSIKIYEYMPKPFVPNQPPASFLGSPEILEQNQFRTIAKIKNIPEGNATIVLSERYQPGWMAFIINNSRSDIVNFINKNFPFIGRQQIAQHYVVNNWKNGWTIHSSMINDESLIIIIFLPQYLEHIGLMLLILSPLGFVIKRIL